ncbi:uncharacterized protein ATC70_008746 [Mucor velutinosus]|uniref:Choice-of-anchor A domain-containing protein n=1 Tax=Mucor velutinosus TaxID=708070 RepID=A0AAN7I241_9FUNG|nr:hypothetical protein ATC70_008746 [Mucor velutinosus]
MIHFFQTTLEESSLIQALPAVTFYQLKFNAVFFGNFITSEAQDIFGLLAVGGDFNAHACTVNTQHGADCSDVVNRFDGYGLIVGREDPNFKYSDVHVHGAVFLPDASERMDVEELDNACSVYNDRGTGLMNFTQVQLSSVAISQQFSLLPPTLHLSADGTLTRVGTNTYDYDVITFGSCGSCSYGETFSSPDAIHYGIGDWNGPMGMSWPSRLIINIAVLGGTTIAVQGNQPSLGMNVCNTVLNFYPSDNVGSYASGTFQLDRATGGQLGGFILLPEGGIIDENHGEFAGQIVANNYRWICNGIDIHDYQAIGGNCRTTDVCLPVFIDDTVDNRPIKIDPPSLAHNSDYNPNVLCSNTNNGNVHSSESSSESNSSSESSNNSSESSSESSSTANPLLSSNDQTPTSTYCPTETSTECHVHQHHVTRTQYQCEQGFYHDEEVLVCEDDGHHHHRKDDYVGDDDDNFEDDPEFGLYNLYEFDEECDVDHGVVNDDDQGDYRYYQYMSKTHYSDDEEDEDDDDEEEDEDEDDNEENEDDDEEDEDDDEEDEDEDEDEYEYEYEEDEEDDKDDDTY